VSFQVLLNQPQRQFARLMAAFDEALNRLAGDAIRTDFSREPLVTPSALAAMLSELFA